MRWLIAAIGTFEKTGRPTSARDLAIVLDEPVSWAALRAQCAEGVLQVSGVTGNVAAWMDDAMFAQEVMGGLPALDDLLETFDVMARPGLARRVREVIAAHGLPARYDPNSCSTAPTTSLTSSDGL